MKLLSFALPAEPDIERLGAIDHEHVVDLKAASERVDGASGKSFPSTMRALLAAGDNGLQQARRILSGVKNDSGSGARNYLFKESEVVFLPPISNPEKFLCIGKNNRKHLEELRKNSLLTETPQEPTAFVKLPSSLIGHGAEVVRPDGIVRLDYEPELVFVIGKRALGVKRDQAMNYVAGITLLNDLTCRDLQQREVASGSRFWTGKNIPGFGPLGPYLITMDEVADPYDLWLSCSVNGQQRLRYNSSEQIWKIGDIIEHFSRFIPLEPGDLFSTGSPGGVAVGQKNAAELFLKPGDVVDVEIENMALLRTTIIAPGQEQAKAA
ncbi:MAG TPA: fumarylacetoacetate hydrolase family protein [Burkholderiales bacterium]|nr:fumarylacetoacetate hydrolase family protein [Burkholderiales bacterium]